MSDENIIGQSTATAALNKVRDDLACAIANAETAMANLRAAVVAERPRGVLKVEEIAEAIGRDRNAVDTWYSHAGATVKGKQTRVTGEASDEQRMAAVDQLADLAGRQRGSAAIARVMRAERDRVVALVYSSKILGPSAIASAVDVDRNHVLRIARKSGVKPVWRTDENVRNQYSVPVVTDAGSGDVDPATAGI